MKTKDLPLYIVFIDILQGVFEETSSPDQIHELIAFLTEKRDDKIASAMSKYISEENAEENYD